MATVYLKKVSSWSSSEWSNASVSYVVGQRVRFQTSVQISTPSYVTSPTTFNQWKTYVCLVDHTSTATTPENDATNWIEAGNSREYPYFCLDGDLVSGGAGTQGEVYLNSKDASGGYFAYATTGYEGMLWYHTREGVADNEVGKIVLMGDVFSHSTSINRLSFNRLIVESDPAQEKKASIALVNCVVGIGQSIYNVVPCRSELKNINLYLLQSNSPYLFSRGDFTHKNNGAAFYLENCRVSDRGAEVGLSNPPITSYGYSITYNAYLSAKGTIFDFGYLYLSHGIYFNTSGHLYQAHASGDITPLDADCINCTFNFATASDQTFTTPQPLFCNFHGGTVKNCIVYVENTAQTGALSWLTGTGTTSSESNFAFIKNFTGGASSGFSAASGLTVANPLFINASKGDVRLRPASPCIGGGKEELTGVSWLCPGNTYNGDGSAKGPASADGQPGAFNSFTAVKDAAVAGNITYGSTVVIVNGTYSWPSEWQSRPSNNNFWNGANQYEGFVYQAESNGDVVFDNSMASGTTGGFGFNDGGLQRDTSFIGVVFKNINGTGVYWGTFAMSGGDRTSTVIFNSCKFLNIIVGQDLVFMTKPRIATWHTGPDVHLLGCEVYWAADSTTFGSVMGWYTTGHYDGWKVENCSFFNGGVHLSTFAGRNATNGNGYYGCMTVVQGADYGDMKFKNNIFDCNADPGGSLSNDSNRITWNNLTAVRRPTFEDCAFHNIQDLPAAIVPDANNSKGLDPQFIAPDSHQFQLRPSSPLIGGPRKYPSATNIWYVNFASGNDSNDGKSPITAMATLSAAHTASANNDTIYIVDEQVTLSAHLVFEGGRIYRSLTQCSFDGGNAYHVEINNLAGVKTELIKFKFLNLNHANWLVQPVGSDSSTILQIKSCEIRGTLTGVGSVIGYTDGAIGTCIKDTAIFCSFLATADHGSRSLGFHYLTNCEMSGCTLVVAPNSNASSTLIYIGGKGGCGAHSHTPPFGRQIVKNCVVYGNNRMRYGPSPYTVNSGNGSALGFTSNCGTTSTNANFIVYNTALYGILNADNGKWPEYNGVTNNYWGSVKTDLGISDSLAAQLFYDDPSLINPNKGEIRLRPDSNLIGKGI